MSGVKSRSDIIWIIMFMRLYNKFLVHTEKLGQLRHIVQTPHTKKDVKKLATIIVKLRNTIIKLLGSSNAINKVLGVEKYLDDKAKIAKIISAYEKEMENQKIP